MSSRRESSWYFGDGAVLLNDTNTALRATAKITPLDPVLGSSVARRQDGNSFGVRVSRRLTPRFAAEFSADYNSGHVTMSSAGLTGIEATRGTFTSAFNGLFATGPFTVATLTSNSTIHDAVGHQIFATGVLNINLKTHGTFIPYASVGGGVVVNGGDSPGASLVGNYRFTFGSPVPVPINETDTVTVRYTISDHALVGVLGGGFKYHVSPRVGVRLDVRAHFSKNSINNLVDANPAAVSSTPTGGLASFTTPSVQFSTSAGAPTTLSGPAIASFRTFTGTGTQTQFSIVPGFFWRF